MNVGYPHLPSWAGFISSGFDGIEQHLPMAASVGAALILKLTPEEEHFALTFGTTGRFLLKQEAWQRGYGLLTALNMIYPRAVQASSAGSLLMRRGEAAKSFARGSSQAERQRSRPSTSTRSGTLSEEPQASLMTLNGAAG